MQTQCPNGHENSINDPSEEDLAAGVIIQCDTCGTKYGVRSVAGTSEDQS